METKNDRVIVVGGGAAGMMAAATAAALGARVTLIEKNEKLGKKLFLTGKGRCNVTNAAGREAFFANLCVNGKFLYSAFSDFDCQAIEDFLTRAGCPLKTERGDRVFPRSDHSSDVIAAFSRELAARGVEVLLKTRVSKLLWKESAGAEPAGQKQITGVVLSDGRNLEASAVILCTGGLSYPSTGSTGDGYAFAAEAGHSVTALSPGLVPLRIRESWCAELMGLSLRNVEACLREDGREVFRGFGELLFTHFGVSGPLILSASSRLGRGDGTGKKGRETEKTLSIDLKPALDMEQLDRRLLRDFGENSGRQFKNALGDLLPARLIPVMVRLSGIDPQTRVNEITRQTRRAFADLVKHLPLTVEGTAGYEEAVITRGGVSVREVNPSTMESKKAKGLYFAGEVLDLDAMTGGFNLQIAWSTGHLAGQSSVSRFSGKQNGSKGEIK